MALSLEAEQRLGKVDLIKLFGDRRKEWTAAAKTAYKYLKDTFPKNAKIRPDDVAGVLRPILAVNGPLREHLDAGRLTQKYWLTDFTDLILDRTWNEISK
jgi:hypothetical protein